jgi:hypothetical protein
MPYVIAGLTCRKGGCRIDFAAPKGHESRAKGEFPVMNSNPHV